jgi:hypothetical protein
LEFAVFTAYVRCHPDGRRRQHLRGHSPTSCAPKFVLVTAAKVGVPESWKPCWAPSTRPPLSVCCSASSAWPPIGTAAAIGLILYFVAAIITHLRARDHSIGPAAAFLLLAVAALVLGRVS